MNHHSLGFCLLLGACAVDSPSANTDLDIYDYTPGNTDLVESSDGTTGGGPGGVPASWDGPTIEPVADRAWGGLGIAFYDLDCALWWSLVGDPVTCSGCTLAFEFLGDSIGDECGYGVGDIGFQLEVRRGAVYGYGSYWGAATYGGGLLAWDGGGAYGYYNYYGFVNY